MAKNLLLIRKMAVIQNMFLTDISTSFERVADHCSNIAIYVLQSDQEEMDPHNFLIQHGMAGNKEFQDRYIEYKNKYIIE